ncbi:MAG: aminomethyltransferase family protein [Burkholderiales bacterium]
MPAPALHDYFAGRGVAQLDLEPGVTTPLRFSDPREEHLATRRSCGLFDFSFMGCAEIAGRESLACIDYVQTRRLDGLPSGKLAYTLLLREDGTVLNDATVWHVEDDRYWLMTGCRADLRHLRHLAGTFDVKFRDISSQHAVLAVQGPHAFALVAQSLPGFVPALTPYFGFAEARFGAARCLIARIGYSGESGCELVIGSAHAPALWQRLLDDGADFGLRPGGFAAVDSLRIEAGHLLFSRELSLPAYPGELGLSRLADAYRGSFHGAGRLLAARHFLPRFCLVGLLPVTRGATDLGALQRIADVRDHPIAHGSGLLTSVAYSPLFSTMLGLGYVSPVDRHPGTRVALAGGLAAIVARRPFYDPAKALPRRAS